MVAGHHDLQYNLTTHSHLYSAEREAEILTKYLSMDIDGLFTIPNINRDNEIVNYDLYYKLYCKGVYIISLFRDARELNIVTVTFDHNALIDLMFNKLEEFNVDIFIYEYYFAYIAT